MRDGEDARELACSPIRKEEAEMNDAMTPRKAIEFAVKTEELGTKFYQPRRKS
jgi:hypothetical protein